jgi:tetratricopeptide (TPR) repeat protein
VIPAAIVAVLLLLAGAGEWTLRAATAAAVRPTPEAERALRARAADLFARREQARMEGGVSLEDLQRDLARLAADLEAAGLDSLASTAHYRTAGVLNRLSRDAEAERHLHLAVAAALRAHARRQEMAARVSLVMVTIERNPELGLRAARALAPRLQALDFHGNLGDLHSAEARALMDLGRWSEALVSARRAVDSFGRAGNQRLQANALTQCSQALRFQGRHAEALALTDSVLAIGKRQPLGSTLSRVLLERTSLLRTLHRDDEALAAVNEALAEDRRRGDHRAVRADRLFRSSLLLELDRPRVALLEVDTLRQEMLTSESRPTLIRVTTLHATALRDLGRSAESDSLLASELPAFERWRATLASDEDRTAVAEHAMAAYALWARVRIEQGRPAEAWQVAERGRAAALEMRVDAADVPALEPLLGRLRLARAAIAQYDGLGTGTGNVFLLAGGALRAFPLSRRARMADVETAVGVLSSSRGGSARGAAARPAALDSLSSALLAEAWPLLPKDVERLIVVPPWKADALPWESLPVPGARDGARVGDRVAVSYAPSAGVLAVLDARRPEGRGLTIVADPAVDADRPEIAALGSPMRGAVLRPLPGARAEARRLAEPGAVVLIGRDATLRRLRQAPPASVLHFATHAVEDPRVAMRGGLVLAGADALLTPAAVESLGIAADLVTLSGCGTMGSTLVSGEGAFGLARSFLIAGARSVVTTRWDVEDRAASRFMQLFYAGLRSGLARDVSLARATAQLEHENYPVRDCRAFLLIGLPDAPVGRWAGKP